MVECIMYLCWTLRSVLVALKSCFQYRFLAGFSLVILVISNITTGLHKVFVISAMKVEMKVTCRQSW